MKLYNVELAIKVRGRPIIEYLHEDKTFVEGREGSEYEIEIRNNNARRIEAVVSVDGLSVIDGKTAGAYSTGYLVDAGQVISIPGWRLDSGSVAKFAFAGKKSSYATQMTGDARNNGIIGVMAFMEKPQWNPGIFCSAATASPLDWNTAIGASPSHYYDPGTSSYAASAVFRGLIGASNSMMSSSVAGESSQAVAQSIGTAFGDATAFRTTQVSFERGSCVATLLIYYDDKRGLRKRGVIMDGKPKRHEPQAFPGTGCTPPPSWNG